MVDFDAVGLLLLWIIDLTSVKVFSLTLISMFSLLNRLCPVFPRDEDVFGYLVLSVLSNGFVLPANRY